MNVSDRAHAELRRRLMTGHYDPGTRLMEETIAADLGVSRTPVRAALRRLVAEGLLKSEPNRGVTVSEWRDGDIEDVFEMRVMMEGRACALATRHVSEADIDRMRDLNETIAEAVITKKPGYLDIVNEANLAFHMAPYEHCGSARLRMFGTSLLEYPLLIGGFYIYSEADMAESIRQHDEIVSAIRARNETWAEAAVACHLSAAISRFRRLRASEGGSGKAVSSSTGELEAQAAE